MRRQLKILALADLHCGCPRIDPFHFQACIEEYVIPRITRDLSHVVIAGDFFDLMVTMNSIVSVIAMNVISLLKKACYENGVKLRVLRGTYTHDRNQLVHFTASSPEYNSCIKMYDSLSVEHDDDTGVDLLYMPDNLKCSDIYQEVENLLQSHSLKQVDVVIHHGYFKHMLPFGIPEPSGTLDFDKFKRFYTGCVLNGHVHTPSIYHNVVSIGSFDRFAYGEEEPKGLYIVTRNDDKYTFEFVENKSANPFWTVNLKEFGENSERAFDYFAKEWLPKLEKVSFENASIHIRIMSDSTGIVEGCAAMLNGKVKNVVVDKGAVTKKENEISNAQMNLEELPKITPDNLLDLLVPIVQKSHPNTNPQEIAKVIKECQKG